MTLSAADRRRLEAAEGFPPLGLPMEANEELESIAPEELHLARIAKVTAGFTSPDVEH